MKQRFGMIAHCLGVALVLAAPAPAAAAARPNIVVFVADDASPDLGAYGNRSIKTPHLDRLAREGLVFDNAFLTTPQCSPSRTSMLAGRFPHTIGTEDLHVGLDAKTKILPSYLAEAGYFTGFLLKGHFGENATKQFHWNDDSFPDDYFAGRWNAKAIDNFKAFLDKAGQKPFFLWVGFFDPHRLYGDAPNAAPRVNDPARVTVPPYLVDSPTTRRDLADYYDEITRLDDHVGQMMGELGRRGLAQNTLMVYVSDNGMPFPRGKGALYDGGIKTPLIMNWPGKIKPGGRYKGMASSVDLAPTLLEVAGVGKPEAWYGRSLTPAFTDLSWPGRKEVFAERNWHGTDEHSRCIRTERHKLIATAYTEQIFGQPPDVGASPSARELRLRAARGRLLPGQAVFSIAPRPAVELYDLQRDPWELNNLADDPRHAKTIAGLVGRLTEWGKETGDHPPHLRRRGDRSDRATGAPLPKFWESAVPD